MGYDSNINLNGISSAGQRSISGNCISIPMLKSLFAVLFNVIDFVTPYRKSNVSGGAKASRVQQRGEHQANTHDEVHADPHTSLSALRKQPMSGLDPTKSKNPKPKKHSLAAGLARMDLPPFAHIVDAPHISDTGEARGPSIPWFHAMSKPLLLVS